MEGIFQAPSLRLFNYDWKLLLLYMENMGNPPFHFEGDLVGISTIGSLFSLTGKLDLSRTNTKTLGTLQIVGGDLDLRDTPIESLGNLKSVGGNLIIVNTPALNLTKKEIRTQVYIKGSIIRGKQVDL